MPDDRPVMWSELRRIVDMMSEVQPAEPVEPRAVPIDPESLAGAITDAIIANMPLGLSTHWQYRVILDAIKGHLKGKQT